VGATPALLATLGVLGCGGTVIVEENSDGSGSAGSGSSGTGATGTGGTGNVGQGGVSFGGAGGIGQGGGGYGQGGAGGSGEFLCDVLTGPYQELVYACADNFGPTCPEALAPEVYDAMSASLNWDDCSGGCCDGAYVSAVPCGPDPGGVACCYYAVVETYSVCEGRPFTVGDETRTASVSPRGDWLGEPCGAGAPSTASLDEGTRKALRDAWTADALFEHASIASFARFSLELLSLGAPPTLVSASHAALADEIRHAQLCFGLASTYAGLPVGPGPLPMDGAPLVRADRRAILLSTLREGCVGETIAALIAAGARDAATDPAVKSALSEIAADESEHAELAWRALAWAIEDDPALCDAVEAELVGARADVSSYHSPLQGDRSALRAHGRLPEAELVAIAERAMAEVVLPCAALMIATARRRHSLPSGVQETTAALG